MNSDILNSYIYLLMYEFNGINKVVEVHPAKSVLEKKIERLRGFWGNNKGTFRIVKGAMLETIYEE